MDFVTFQPVELIQVFWLFTGSVQNLVSADQGLGDPSDVLY